MKPLKNGDEDLFLQSLADTKIKNAPVSDLEAVLRLSMLKVGLRATNLPSAEEKAVLLSHAISNYGNHTVSEIRLAFEMAIAGKLGVDPNCYENFSCMYFSSIMNAFRSWASQVKFYTDRQRVEEPKQLNAPKMSDDEVIELAKNVWQSTGNFAFLPVNAYGAMTRKGLINFTEAEKSDIRTQAANQIVKMYGIGDKEDRKKERDSFAKKIAVMKILTK